MTVYSVFSKHLFENLNKLYIMIDPLVVCTEEYLLGQINPLNGSQYTLRD